MTAKEAAIKLFSGEIEEYELTNKQFLYLRQMRAAFGMLLDARSKVYIVGALMLQFDIRQSQAYLVIRDAEEVFSSQQKVNKIAKRMVAEEMALAAFRSARAADDNRGMTAATKAYIEANALNIEDPDLPPLDKLQASLNVLLIDEKARVSLDQLLQQGVIDLTQAPPPAQITENAEYEELDAE